MDPMGDHTVPATNEGNSHVHVKTENSMDLQTPSSQLLTFSVFGHMSGSTGDVASADTARNMSPHFIDTSFPGIPKPEGLIHHHIQREIDSSSQYSLSSPENLIDSSSSLSSPASVHQESLSSPGSGFPDTQQSTLVRKTGGLRLYPDNTVSDVYPDSTDDLWSTLNDNAVMPDARKALRIAEDSDAPSSSVEHHEVEGFDASGAKFASEYKFTKISDGENSVFKFGSTGYETQPASTVLTQTTNDTVKPAPVTETPKKRTGPATSASARSNALLKKAKEPILCQQFPASIDGVELQIINQPEEQHRARYRTEGSRGSVKDRSGNSHPSVKMIGYNSVAVLQVFVATDSGKIKPHGFYQVCKVSGKTSSPCTEKIIEGTSIIEMELNAENDMTARIDCVGILKLRNVDVERRFGNIKTRKKSVKTRLAYRACVQCSDGSSQVIQVASAPILCTQPIGLPEIGKMSHTEGSVLGGQELFIIGKNFMKASTCRVMFQEVDETEQVVWEQEAAIDKDYFQSTHLICKVPEYRNLEVTEPVRVFVTIHCGAKLSEPCDQTVYTYLPRSHVEHLAIPRHQMEVDDRSQSFNSLDYHALQLAPPTDMFGSFNAGSASTIASSLDSLESENYDTVIVNSSVSEKYSTLSKLLSNEKGSNVMISDSTDSPHIKSNDTNDAFSNIPNLNKLTPTKSESIDIGYGDESLKRKASDDLCEYPLDSSSPEHIMIVDDVKYMQQDSALAAYASIRHLAMAMKTSENQQSYKRTYADMEKSSAAHYNYEINHNMKISTASVMSDKVCPASSSRILDKKDSPTLPVTSGKPKSIEHSQTMHGSSRFSVSTVTTDSCPTKMETDHSGAYINISQAQRSTTHSRTSSESFQNDPQNQDLPEFFPIGPPYSSPGVNVMQTILLTSSQQPVNPTMSSTSNQPTSILQSSLQTTMSTNTIHKHPVNQQRGAEFQPPFTSQTQTSCIFSSQSQTDYTSIPRHIPSSMAFVSEPVFITTIATPICQTSEITQSLQSQMPTSVESQTNLTIYTSDPQDVVHESQSQSIPSSLQTNFLVPAQISNPHSGSDARSLIQQSEQSSIRQLTEASSNQADYLDIKSSMEDTFSSPDAKISLPQLSTTKQDDNTGLPFQISQTKLPGISEFYSLSTNGSTNQQNFDQLYSSIQKLDAPETASLPENNVTNLNSSVTLKSFVSGGALHPELENHIASVFPPSVTDQYFAEPPPPTYQPTLLASDQLEQTHFITENNNARLDIGGATQLNTHPRDCQNVPALIQVSTPPYSMIVSTQTYHNAQDERQNANTQGLPHTRRSTDENSPLSSQSPLSMGALPVQILPNTLTHMDVAMASDDGMNSTATHAAPKPVDSYNEPQFTGNDPNYNAQQMTNQTPYQNSKFSYTDHERQQYVQPMSKIYSQPDNEQNFQKTTSHADTIQKLSVHPTTFQNVTDSTMQSYPITKLPPPVGAVLENSQTNIQPNTPQNHSPLINTSQNHSPLTNTSQNHSPLINTSQNQSPEMNTLSQSENFSNISSQNAIKNATPHTSSSQSPQAYQQPSPQTQMELSPAQNYSDSPSQSVTRTPPQTYIPQPQAAEPFILPTMYSHNSPNMDNSTTEARSVRSDLPEDIVDFTTMHSFPSLKDAGQSVHNVFVSPTNSDSNIKSNDIRVDQSTSPPYNQGFLAGQNETEIHNLDKSQLENPAKNTLDNSQQTTMDMSRKQQFYQTSHTNMAQAAQSFYSLSQQSVIPDTCQQVPPQTTGDSFWGERSSSNQDSDQVEQILNTLLSGYTAPEGDNLQSSNRRLTSSLEAAPQLATEQIQVSQPRFVDTDQQSHHDSPHDQLLSTVQIPPQPVENIPDIPSDLQMVSSIPVASHMDFVMPQHISSDSIIQQQAFNITAQQTQSSIQITSPQVSDQIISISKPQSYSSATNPQQQTDMQTQQRIEQMESQKHPFLNISHQHFASQEQLSSLQKYHGATLPPQIQENVKLSDSSIMLQQRQVEQTREVQKELPLEQVNRSQSGSFHHHVNDTAGSSESFHKQLSPQLIGVSGDMISLQLAQQQLQKAQQQLQEHEKLSQVHSQQIENQKIQIQQQADELLRAQQMHTESLQHAEQLVQQAQHTLLLHQQLQKQQNLLSDSQQQLGNDAQQSLLLQHQHIQPNTNQQLKTDHQPAILFQHPQAQTNTSQQLNTDNQPAIIFQHPQAQTNTSQQLNTDNQPAIIFQHPQAQTNTSQQLNTDNQPAIIFQHPQAQTNTSQQLNTDNQPAIIFQHPQAQTNTSQQLNTDNQPAIIFQHPQAQTNTSQQLNTDNQPAIIFQHPQAQTNTSQQLSADNQQAILFQHLQTQTNTNQQLNTDNQPAILFQLHQNSVESCPNQQLTSDQVMLKLQRGYQTEGLQITSSNNPHTLLLQQLKSDSNPIGNPIRTPPGCQDSEQTMIMQQLQSNGNQQISNEDQQSLLLQHLNSDNQASCHETQAPLILQQLQQQQQQNTADTKQQLVNEHFAQQQLLQQLQAEQLSQTKPN